MFLSTIGIGYGIPDDWRKVHVEFIMHHELRFTCFNIYEVLADRGLMLNPEHANTAFSFLLQSNPSCIFAPRTNLVPRLVLVNHGSKSIIHQIFNAIQLLYIYKYRPMN